MSGVSKVFFKAEPGLEVMSEGRRYCISRFISVDSVLAIDDETKQEVRLRVETLVPVNEASASTDEPGVRDLALYSNEEWAVGQRRFSAIKPLLEDPLRSRMSAEKIAKKMKVHVATIYKWLKDYQMAGHVAALVPVKRGRKTGSRLLGETQETIIATTIEDTYLIKQRPRPKDVATEVSRRCRLAGVLEPHENTVRKRIAEINPALQLRRRGKKEEARNRYNAIQGNFPGGEHPLDVVQIDHTPADVILVDEVHRLPIGRPWLTLAIDVSSRMVVGIYLSFEQPGAASVGLCLANAICPKREFLAERSISGEWPAWGLMRVVHADNAKEFRGNVLKRACDDYDIDLQWRPVLLPHFGGHIERLMGTFANEIRKLPGATFSNPTQRKGYESEKESALTLKEFETHLLDFIVNVYHQRLHTGIGMSPKRKWELGILGDEKTKGTGMIAIPEDPLRIQLDFMPFYMRSVQQYGIQIDNITYYDSVLDPYVNAADPKNAKLKRQFLVRRDPRDISKIYFFDEAAERYVAIAYRNRGLPAISVWELNEVMTRLKEEGKRNIDEGLIFESIERMRARVENAKKTTKATRRQMTRKPPAQKTPHTLKPQPTDMAKPISESAAYDPFAEPIKPFAEVLLQR
jgi:putative transposase